MSSTGKTIVKWFLIIVGSVIGLAVAAVLLFAYWWRHTDDVHSKKIAQSYSQIHLPSELTLKSKERGNEELAEVWRYDYGSSLSEPDTQKLVMDALTAQGFDIPNRYDYSVEAKSQKLGLLLDIEFKNRNTTDTYITAREL